MNKKILFFCAFKLNASFFDSQGNFMCQESKNKEDSSNSFIKPYLNFVLSTSIVISCFTNYLFYNAIGNKSVEKNLKKTNPDVDLSEIKANIICGFIFSIILTFTLIYIYYIYNGYLF
ncbi:hypothetical protein [Alphaproteobacteria bacterium endosymbiont of Tiliacea citrago]|uniref:hypothetical protein n=1 Tax=Alphaproteobacteria bacterium endosymbiont of Tiliacea citrago TaxID=3077944 RepID=UPI00313ADF01